MCFTKKGWKFVGFFTLNVGTRLGLPTLRGKILQFLHPRKIPLGSANMVGIPKWLPTLTVPKGEDFVIFSPSMLVLVLADQHWGWRFGGFFPLGKIALFASISVYRSEKSKNSVPCNKVGILSDYQGCGSKWVKISWFFSPSRFSITGGDSVTMNLWFVDCAQGEEHKGWKFGSFFPLVIFSLGWAPPYSLPPLGGRVYMWDTLHSTDTVAIL